MKVEVVAKPSINVGVNVSMVATVGLCWMDLIIDFLAEDRVPTDEKEVERVRRTAAWYWLSTNWKLYRRSFNEPYLQCLHPNNVEELLAKLHE